MSNIFNNAVVHLECQGNIPGPRFLDGMTHNGGVRLAAGTNQGETGTFWHCMAAGNAGEFFMASAGAVFGPRYLDGNTITSGVALAGDTLPPFSGTKWRIVEVSPGIVTIECLGSIPGNRFLDGVTGNGTVILSPNTNPPFTGTRWRAILIATPFLDVRTERHQLGAFLSLRGTGFRPFDDVRFVAEGIIGRVNHAPFPLGSFARTDANGAFQDDSIDIRFSSAQQPNSESVFIRATDRGGISAAGFTSGFNSRP
jgi:hypothetical protein